MSLSSLKSLASSLLVCLLLIHCDVPLARVSCVVIPTLPADLRVQSQLVYLDDNQQKLLKISEFISRPDGSIRLDVADHSAGTDPEQAVRMTYFRLFQEAPETKQDAISSRILVGLDPRSSQCEAAHTSDWALSDLSFLLEKLTLAFRAINASEPVSEDATAIGPTALLQMVYANLDLLRLDSSAYEDIVMAEVHYFSATLHNFSASAHSTDCTAQLIVAVSAERVKFAENEFDERAKRSVQIGTPLSEVHLSAHPAMVALVVMSSGVKMDKIESAQLLDSLKQGHLDWIPGESPQQCIIVSYDSIQERSLSRHAALEHLNDELANPFQMPVGCGSLASQAPFHLNPQQFSGQFEALGAEDKFAVAYDRPTNHLRYDTLNEFKLIYSLTDQLATFISTSSQLSNEKGKHSSEGAQQSSFYHQAHQNKERCAQTKIVNEREPASDSRSWLFDKESVADILGLGEQVGLMYLGQQRLPADDNDELMFCRVFEREVSALQIPALLGMHAPSELNTRGRRFYVLFYFVHEIDNMSESRPEAWKSMWLKRLELISIDPERKYQLLASRLTFSTFSWSLESIATSDRLTSRQTELGHPAHTFDTLECWSERGQLQLNLLLKQVSERDWDEALNGGARLKSSMQMLSSFEDTLLAFLARTLIMPRAEINGLEIVAPSRKLSATSTTTSNSLATLGDLHVSFKITKPFNYLYKRTLLGWAHSYLELLAANQTRMIKSKSRMAKHECSSRLVTELGQPYSVHMLYCPNIGCAYLTVDKLEEVNYTRFQDTKEKSSGNPFEGGFQMCEIFLLAKTMSMRAIESDVYKPEVIRRYLSQSSLLVRESGSDDERMQQQEPYRAQVAKLSLLEGHDRHDRWDDELIFGLCYKFQITLEFEGKPYEDKRHGLRVIQLELDQHHSRAHCRRACLLYQFCQTYSYDRASRQCTLTNIHRRYFHESKFQLDAGKLESSFSCSIYALDQAVLYKRASRVEMKMPVELAQDKELQLLNISLTHCASLCHMDEFALDVEQSSSGSRPRLINCRSFGYLSLHSLCVLRNTGQDFDYKTGLVKREEHLEGAGDLEARIGSKQQMYEAAVYERYTRNYASYFSARYGIKVYLMGPAQEDGWVDDEQAETVLQGLSLDECQRECSMLRQECAMLDYCLVDEKGYQVQMCHLYSVRSPLSFASFKLDRQPHPAGRVFQKLQADNDSSLVKQLDHDEKLFYLHGQSYEHELVVHSRNCHHFYLDGNNLYLKRLLSRSARSYTRENSIEQLVEKDEATSRSDKAWLAKSAHPPDFIPSDGHVHELQTVSKICLGLGVGILIFLLQSTVVELASKVNLLTSLHSRRWFHSFPTQASRSRTQRTMSTVDIVELADVDSP